MMRSIPNMDIVKYGERKTPFDIFQHCVNKMMTIKRFQRKKEFRFADLVKFLKGQQLDEEEIKKNQADELLFSVRPLLTNKISKLLTDRIDRILGAVERQTF